jgi:diguanylate cyclase (GGDEF)-like protein
MSATPKSLLIIDDSEITRAQIKRELMGGSLFDRIYEASDGMEAFKILLGHQIDLILCDLVMPRIDGIKFLGMINGNEHLRDIPVIMLTGRGEREMKISLLGMGASDYVTKPFDAGELIARVKVHLKIKSLQDELKQSNGLLKQLSNTDPLTLLYNRRYLMETLDREILRSVRKRAQLSIVMIDIDHFKKINDTYGHQNGDQVLVAVADTFRTSLRVYDIPARYGGEEFVLSLPDTPHEDAVMVAERLRKTIETLEFSGELTGLKTTVSMGVATYPDNATNSAPELIKAADEALYRAKNAGRNRVISAMLLPAMTIGHLSQSGVLTR